MPTHPHRLHVRLIGLARPMSRRFGSVCRSEFVRHGALVFLSTNFANALGYAFHFVLSRRLGVGGYGELATLISVSTVASFPATVFSMSVVKASSEMRDDPGALVSLVRSIVRTSFFAFLICGAAGLLLAAPIAAYLKIGHPAFILGTALFVASMFAMSGVRGVLQGTERFWPFSLSISLEAAIKTSLAVGLAFAGYGVGGAIWGTALASIATLCATFAALRPIVQNDVPPAPIDFTRILRSTGGVAGAMFSLTLLGSADVIIVKHFFSAHVAGLYSVISLSGRMLLFLVGFIPMIVMPKATARALAGRPPIGVLLQALAAVVVCSCAALFLFWRYPLAIVSTLAGYAYAPAAHYIVLYGLAMVGLVITTTLVYYRISLHRFEFVLPLIVVAGLDLAGMYRFHDTIGHIITVVLAGNIVSSAVCVIGIVKPVTHTGHTVRIKKSRAQRREVWEVR